MGLPSTPYFLCLHYFRLIMAHSYFTTSHTTRGFATSLSPSSFRPVCFLKAYLFILWAYLFIFYLFTNSFSPMLLGFFSLLGFPKWASTPYILHFHPPNFPLNQRKENSIYFLSFHIFHSMYQTHIVENNIFSTPYYSILSTFSSPNQTKPKGKPKFMLIKYNLLSNL